MSDLTFIEKKKLEELLQMGSGYVSKFTNRDLAELVAESTHRNFHDAKYEGGGGSMANRL